MADCEFIVDGQRILIDHDMLPLMSRYTWRVTRHGAMRYVTSGTSCKGKKLHMALHRMVIGAKVGEVVDHVNGDTFDNRRENLRIVTVTENNQNVRRARVTSKSGVLGVNWHKRTKKWRAQIRLNKASIHIGYFDDINEASAAYQAKKRELHPVSC